MTGSLIDYTLKPRLFVYIFRKAVRVSYW